MLSRLSMAIALVLAAGLLAAGCGDDDDETTTAATTATTTAAGATGATGAATGEPLSEAEFVEQAEAICADVNKQIDGGGGGGSAEDFATDTLVPAVEDGLADLGELTPPEADADQYQELLDSGQKQLDELTQDPGSLGPGSFKEFNEIASDLGLKECAG